MRWTGSLTTVIALGGCAVVEERSVIEQHELGDHCGDRACGGNSPIVATYPFHDLHKRGFINSDGFAIVKFEKETSGTAVKYDVDVVAGKLVGRNPLGDISGADLAGATLTLRHTTSNGTNHYDLRIEAVALTIPYWADAPGGSGTGALEGYHLKWHPTPYSDNEAENVCTNFGPQDALGMDAPYAVVFEGDRINRYTKTFYGYDTHWFNIGCSGHALAKLALNGHTAAAAADGFETRSSDRQAMLKMLAADYCGRGTAFTIPGQKLGWHDANDYTHVTGDVALEARWTSEGAYCLETPRILANRTLEGDKMFEPGIERVIELECGRRPPRCENVDPGDLEDAYVVSVNPL